MTAVLLLFLSSIQTAAQLRVDQLRFKGTHNSFASECGQDLWSCGGCCNDQPRPTHAPPVQVDKFGAWALELDFSILPPGECIVGHSGPDDPDDTWANPLFGFLLREYLSALVATRSISYRPLFLFLEKKNWDRPDDDVYLDAAVWGPALESVLLDAVGGSAHLFGPADYSSAGGWPDIRDLAGKVLVCAFGEGGSYSTDVVFLGGFPGLDAWPMDQCTDSVTVSEAARTCRLLRVDQYIEDWTFTVGGVAPPMPVYVDGASEGGPYTVEADVNYLWDCGADWPVVPSMIVHAQGTFGLPFGTLNDAIARVRDFPGWTVLMAPGTYREAMVINTPVCLQADGGVVRIGW